VDVGGALPADVRAYRTAFSFTDQARVYHPLAFFSASHAARCVACQADRSHPVPVALVGECSMPVV